MLTKLIQVCSYSIWGQMNVTSSVQPEIEPRFGPGPSQSSSHCCRWNGGQYQRLPSRYPQALIARTEELGKEEVKHQSQDIIQGYASKSGDPSCTKSMGQCKKTSKWSNVPKNTQTCKWARFVAVNYNEKVGDVVASPARLWGQSQTHQKVQGCKDRRGFCKGSPRTLVPVLKAEEPAGDSPRITPAKALWLGKNLTNSLSQSLTTYIYIYMYTCYIYMYECYICMYENKIYIQSFSMAISV